MFMVLSSWPIATARVHPVHLANVGQRRAATDPTTKPNDLVVESAYTPCLKKGAFLFLLELCQISTNFDKFW